MMLREEGNYSKKHFGDFDKLKDFKEKYNIDLVTSYQTTYSFRGYADYRKFPEIEDKFDKEHLKEQIDKIRNLIFSCLGLYKGDDNLQKLIDIFNKKIKGFLE